MHSINVHNTLTGKKEPFVPLNGNKVMMYACGPTVYDMSHLGHARMTMVYDVVQRYLRFSGYDVTYVRNITDVDDKIINRAKALGKTPEQVAREFTYTFWHDMHCLNVQPPDYEPKATEFIELMIQFTKELIEKGHAYESAGDVYFDVASFKEYGKLGKKSLEDLLVGARDQVRSQEDLADKKKSPADFALWKSAKEGELAWSSPWGQGRPGWHLECSTMTKHVLGETFDIHAGGEDLVFPHHENEIAQSEALHGKPMSKYWLHNSFVQVNSEKMSKSEGNFSTIQELLAKFSPDTIRLFALQTHYRNPIEFSIEALTASRTALGRILRAAAFAVNSQNGKSFETTGQALLEQTKNQISKATAESLDPVKDETTKQFRAAFIEAMDNDFNTAVAISQLFALADKVFVEKDEAKRQGYATVLVQFARLLGLTLVDTRKQIDSHTVEQIVNLVVELRQNARSNKDYATSDLIRQRLTDAGVSLMDTAGQTTWEKA